MSCLDEIGAPFGNRVHGILDSTIMNEGPIRSICDAEIFDTKDFKFVMDSALGKCISRDGGFRKDLKEASVGFGEEVGRIRSLRDPVCLLSKIFFFIASSLLRGMGHG